MTAQLDPHSRLVAIVGDVVRHGLDTAGVRLGPKAEREIIAHAVEALELAGYTITRAEVPSTVAPIGDNATNEGGR